MMSNIEQLTLKHSINYMHIVKQTHEEKLKMYMKCSKKELAKMLIECNRILDGRNPRKADKSVTVFKFYSQDNLFKTHPKN